MDVDITKIYQLGKWNSLVERSPQATPFHRYESLKVIEAHAEATLHPYVGFDSKGPIGAFPVFEISRGPFSAAFSPPPNLKIPYLGPILISAGNRTRTQSELITCQFIKNCLEQVEDDLDPTFSHVYVGPRYTDVRPFAWNGSDLVTKFTYFVDLQATEEELLMSFSKDARRNINNTDEANYDISVGDESDLDNINKLIQMRHEERDATYNVPSSFVIDLYRALPDEMMRVYRCKIDDRLVGGHITLEHRDMSYGWQGWGDFDADVPVNDLIEWTMMTDARNRGVEWYDFCGANVKRLAEYKSKFNPELQMYFRIQNGVPGMNLISKTYKRIR